ncbi:MAG: ABC transporter permease [Rhizobiales bacterium TMED143]|nr:ABC transporter permease [Rhodobiaceae bacterium]OUV92467.1 MAG: ABC transporter permease [Rhizobiales bacterium TMED143]CAI8353967.1 MAG: putative phospholipid ABC transporter permease protein MlaE [Rhodobiaceae bacterium UBA7378]HCQ82144.1 ABC transporter permease [Rhodobiaceae bacterium]
MQAIATIGRFFLGFFSQTGLLTLFIFQAVKALVTPPIYMRLIGQQIMRIGYYSLPVVALTSFFTGGALAIQIYYGGNQFNSEAIVSSIVALGITRELGPVLGGLMVAGRVSAAIAAEIGTMRVTEQIDALTTLSTDPFKYLVAPRVIAATLCMPVLALIADIIGVLGGFIVGTQSFGFNAAIYVQQTVNFLQPDDVTSGLIKAAVFGFIIAIMGCYHGYNSKGGAQGVGRATTNAVVASSILILAANYLMTSLLFSA